MAALTYSTALALRLAMPIAVAANNSPAVSESPLPVSPLVASSNVERWRPLIAEASRRFEIPESWIAAVMQAESRGLTRLNGRPITSRAGAMGLMQLMPGTYVAMRALHGLGSDPHDPRDNILAGAAYLRAMHERFGYPGLFAAYNAGPARYERHLRDGKPLPGETRRYIATLARVPATPSMPPATLSGAYLFFTLGPTGNRARDTALPSPNPSSSDAEPVSKSPVRGGLFVPLNAAPGRR